MTWPTVAVGTTNIDAGTDSPATARTELKDAIDKLNQMMAHVTAFAATIFDDANAAAARTTLGAAASGANADITSLSAPALGAATATTAAPGTNTTQVATTAFATAAAAAVKTDIGLSDYFESTNQSVVPNSVLNVAHGLGAVPKFFHVVLKCTTAELGYSVGDEVAYNFSFFSGVSVVQASADATNVVIIYAGGATSVLHKSTRTQTGITSASWRFVVRAWL